MANLDTLTKEAFQVIVNSLDLFPTILKLSQVNKRLRVLVQGLPRWRNFSLPFEILEPRELECEFYEDDEEEEKRKSEEKKAAKKKKKGSSSSESDSEDDSTAIVTARTASGNLAFLTKCVFFAGVESLDLTGIQSDIPLHRVLYKLLGSTSRFPNLKRLCLAGFKCRFHPRSDDIQLPVLGLTTLNLSDAKVLHSNTLKQLLKASPNLKVLILAHCRLAVDDQDKDVDLFNNCKALETLDVSYTYVGSLIMDALNTLESLKIVYAVHCKNLNFKRAPRYRFTLVTVNLWKETDLKQLDSVKQYITTPNLISKKTTLLHQACKTNDLNLVGYVLSLPNLEPNIRTSSDQILDPWRPCYPTLLRERSNWSRKGNTALHELIESKQSNSEGILQVLLKAKSRSTRGE